MTTYQIIMVRAGSRESIGPSTTDPVKARRRALDAAGKRSRRKIVIVKDGRELPGGAHALDNDVYQQWLASSVDD